MYQETYTTGQNLSLIRDKHIKNQASKKQGSYSLQVGKMLFRKELAILVSHVTSDSHGKENIGFIFHHSCCVAKR
jgi:hypothetical protein